MTRRYTTDLLLGTALLLVLATPTYAKTNGGFETGDFTCWTTSGDSQVVGNNEVGNPPSEGSFQALLGSHRVGMTIDRFRPHAYAPGCHSEPKAKNLVEARGPSRHRSSPWAEKRSFVITQDDRSEGFEMTDKETSP